MPLKIDFMSAKTYYHTLSEVLLFSSQHHDLKKALTHSSFYENPEQDENSKYIFLGMFAFKGKVAEVMRKYVPLTGTQLQHYLGNVFKSKQLEKIYKKYQLNRLVRHGRDFPVQDKHHLFVYALLGFVYEFAEEKYLLRFIYRNFLAETEHLMPTAIVNKDIKAKFLYLAKMYYNAIPEFIEDEKEGICSCKIYFCKKLLVEEQGENIKTLQQRSLKKALQILSEQLEEEWKNNPQNQEIESRLKKEKAEKLAREKAEKLKAYKEKQRKRSEEIAKRKHIRKEEAIQKDEKRRKAKAYAKKRKEELAEQQRRQKVAMANMSVAKRRHLQDKGLLDKGAPPKK